MEGDGFSLLMLFLFSPPGLKPPAGASPRGSGAPLASYKSVTPLVTELQDSNPPP